MEEEVEAEAGVLREREEDTEEVDSVAETEGGARYQGSVSRTTHSVSDGKYQESLILLVGVAVRKEQCRSGYIQNYLGEYGDIARTIDSTFQHPYDEQGLTKDDTKVPSVDEFDFANDPAAKVRYDQVCQERKDLAEFFRKSTWREQRSFKRNSKCFQSRSMRRSSSTK